MDFDTVADELYGLPPGEFVASRDRFAKQARADGDKDLAETIKALRRPTAGAWLANMVVRRCPQQVSRMLGLGDEMRAAQAHLVGDRLRQLSSERVEAIASVAREARRLADELGSTFGGPAADELRATLEAAFASPKAAEILRRGRLTTGLHYSGFELVESERDRESGRGSRPRTQRPDRKPLRRASAPIEARDPHVRAHDGLVAQSQQDASGAEREMKRRLDDFERASREAERSNSQVANLKERLERARQAETKARQKLIVAQKDLDQARARLQRARERLHSVGSAKVASPSSRALRKRSER